MIETVQRLSHELRGVGIPVSQSDIIAAIAALRVIDLGRRDSVRTALASNLVRTISHRPAFDALFGQVFTHPDSSSLADAAASDADRTLDGRLPDDVASPRGFAHLDDEDLRRLLVNALGGANSWMQRVLCRELVRRYSRIRPERPSGAAYYAYQVRTRLRTEHLVADILASDTRHGRDPFRVEFLRRTSAEHAVKEFEQMIQSEVRALLAERGVSPAVARVPLELPEEADFTTAAEETIAEIARLIAPVARRLAANAARRTRPRSRGAVDLRRTIRTSLSTGGVPLRIAVQPPRPGKARLVVLADISGSVARFALFALQLMIAMRSAFNSVRAFVFVDTADEITDILSREHTFAGVFSQINRAGLGTRVGDSSDYGTALRSFETQMSTEIDARTTVVIVGDARGNNRESGRDTLARIARRAHAVHLLVPEPRSLWGVGDSLVREYELLCDSTTECRSLRQLTHVIHDLL